MYCSNKTPLQRDQPTSHLSRHSTPIQQRNTSIGAPIAPAPSTILKPTGQPSCINHHTVRQNIHWDRTMDTEFTSQDARVTCCQGTVTNKAHMNLNSSQPIRVTAATSHRIQLPAHMENKEGRRDSPMCFRCGKQGHTQQQCWERSVFCTKCQCNNHNTEACRRYPTTENTPPGTSTAFNDNMYHPTATPPMLNQQPEP